MTKRLPSIKNDLLHLGKSKDVLIWFGHSSYYIQMDWNVEVSSDSWFIAGWSSEGIHRPESQAAVRCPLFKICLVQPFLGRTTDESRNSLQGVEHSVTNPHDWRNRRPEREHPHFFWMVERNRINNHNLSINICRAGSRAQVEQIIHEDPFNAVATYQVIEFEPSNCIAGLESILLE